MSRVAQWESSLGPRCGGLTDSEGNPPHSRTEKPSTLRAQGLSCVVGAGWGEPYEWGERDALAPVSAESRREARGRGRLRVLPAWKSALPPPEFSVHLVFPGGSVVKNPPAMQETQVLSLGWGDPSEKEMATHSSILALRIPWTEEPGGLQPMGSHTAGHACTRLHTHAHMTQASPSHGRGLTSLLPLFQGCFNARRSKKKLAFFRR